VRSEAQLVPIAAEGEKNVNRQKKEGTNEGREKLRRVQYVERLGGKNSKEGKGRKTTRRENRFGERKKKRVENGAYGSHRAKGRVLTHEDGSREGSTRCETKKEPEGEGPKRDSSSKTKSRGVYERQKTKKLIGKLKK